MYIYIYIYIIEVPLPVPDALLLVGALRLAPPVGVRGVLLINK